MNRYIDIEKEIDILQRELDECYDSIDPSARRAIKDILLHLRNAPAVDAVEVVRCKDCVKRGTHMCEMNRDSYYPRKMKNTAFCSFGEKQ